MKTTYDITLCDDGRFGDEIEQFCQWLNEQGHTAKIKPWESYCYVDGKNTSWEEGADQIIRKLWSDYCHS